MSASIRSILINCGYHASKASIGRKDSSIYKLIYCHIYVRLRYDIYMSDEANKSMTKGNKWKTVLVCDSCYAHRNAIKFIKRVLPERSMKCFFCGQIGSDNLVKVLIIEGDRND
jgi:hypothetical protein